MQLESYKTIFAAITLVGILLFASPAISYFIKPPSEEVFSSIYLLGNNHDMNAVPFNIEEGKNYSVFLNVDNYLGLSSYYSCIVKIGSAPSDLPNKDLGLPSSQPEVYKYNRFINNGETWETQLTFQVKGLTFNQSKAQLSSIIIGGLEYPINREALWNSNRTGYFYYLIVELWLYNSTNGLLQYNNRSVHLMLNMVKQ
jgi:hypothetical protein